MDIYVVVSGSGYYEDFREEPEKAFYDIVKARLYIQKRLNIILKDKLKRYHAQLEEYEKLEQYHNIRNLKLEEPRIQRSKSDLDSYWINDLTYRILEIELI